MTEVAPARHRVLVVDDTPDIRSLVALTLEMAGGGEFDVVGEAGDGEAAIVEARRLQPDLILLDLAMPIMDGLEALPQIRRESPASKVLVLSGFNARELGAEAMAAGAADYMEKGGIAHRLVPRLRELFTPADPEADAPVTVQPHGDTPELDLVGLLAHELLSPVTVLGGYAEVLSRGAATMAPHDIARAADAIGRSAGQLSALIQSLADLKALELDSLDLHVVAFDLGDLVADTLGDLRYLTEQHILEVDAPAGVTVTADPVRIRQVVVNLVSNAAKFTPPGSRMQVGCAAGDPVRLWVHDGGPGIPADKVPELFGKFARLGSRQRGTGIGLYLSRAIARAHGGDLVLVDSDAGARFELELPPEGPQKL